MSAWPRHSNDAISGGGEPRPSLAPGHVDVPRLLELTRMAQGDWAETPWRERASVMRSIRRGLAEEAPGLARECARLRRRPVAEVMASEILPLAEAGRFLQKHAARILRTRRQSGSRFFANPLHVSADIHREPWGVVLVIAPSNYPLFLPGVQVLQALMAGNGVLLKPSPGASSVLRQFAQLLAAGGVPPSLLQILPEDTGPTGRVIEEGVDKVILTGAASTGRKILAQLAPRLTPAIMELSGCDAVLVRRDADLDLTAEALVFGATLNDGATCIAPKRIFVAREIATELEGRLTERLSKIAPVSLNAQAAAEMVPLWRTASAQGAHLLSGEIRGDGRVTGPLLLAGLPRGHRLLKEDFFAPVMTLTVVGSDEEALALVRQCPYALGATIFSRDTAQARCLARRVSAGVVVINDMIAPTADARLPFGGGGQSGFGVTRGREGLLALTRPKVVTRTPGRRRFHFDPVREGDADMFQQLLTLGHGRKMRSRFRALLQLIQMGAKRLTKKSNS